MSEKESENRADDSDLEQGGTPSNSQTSTKHHVKDNEEKEKTTEEIREEELLRDDMRLGGSPEGKVTNEGLRALARASRSFLIYDPRNEAIRDFLRSYRETMYHALEKFGEIELEIRPFEMLRDGRNSTKLGSLSSLNL